MKSLFIQIILITICFSGLTAYAAVGILNVTSESSGVQVKINGEIRGFTPLTLELTPGDYEVKADMIGYASNTKNTKILNDDVTIVHFALEPERFNSLGYLEYHKDEIELGRILITSDVPKSKIYFSGGMEGGGYVYGESMMAQKIYPGLYKLEINKHSTYLEIVDGSVVKAHFNGKNISVTYDNDAKLKLKNYQAFQGDLNWLSAADGLPKAKKENKPVIIVSSKFYDKELADNKNIFDNPLVKDYLNKNFILVKIDENSKREIIISDITTTEANLANSRLYNGYHSQKMYVKTSRLTESGPISLHGLNEVLFFEKTLYPLGVIGNIESESSSQTNIASPIDWIGKKPVIVLFYGSLFTAKTVKPLEILDKIFQFEKSKLNNIKILVVAKKEENKPEYIEAYRSRSKGVCDLIEIELPIILDEGNYFSKYNAVPFTMLILDALGDELDRYDVGIQKLRRKKDKEELVNRIKEVLKKL